MKITILTIGSRGDIQPYLALGVYLKRVGYRVKLATHETFKDLIVSYGLDFEDMGGNIQDRLNDDDIKATIEAANPLQMLGLLVQALEPIMAESLEKSWQACQGADLVISTGIGFWGDDIAAHLGIASVFGLLQPLLPSQEFLSPLMPPQLRLGSGFNWLSHQILNRVYWHMYRPFINPWRESKLGEPPHRGCPFFGDRWRTQPKLFAYSPQVVPHPQDWDQTHHVTGYWFLDQPADFTPPPGLEDFLADGEPPVSIGFGSMVSGDTEQIVEIALASLQRQQQRGILLTGWSGITNADLPDSVFKLESIPHDWLFPRMKAIVHHGGAGTTSAALRAGVPAVVVPFFADQPFWGDRVHRLGVSPTPIPKKQLTVDRLAAAIERATTDAQMHQRATQLGTTIRAETRLATAAQVIDTVLARR